MEEITLATLSAQLHALAGDVTEIKQDVKTMNGRQREDHDRVTKVEERLNLLSMGQLVVTLLGSSIATWLGTRK